MGKREAVLDTANLYWQQNKNHYSLWGESAVQPVLEGVFLERELRPGLFLHATHVDYHCGVSGAGHLSSGLKLIIMLQGRIGLRFDQTHLALGGVAHNCLLLRPRTQDSSARIPFRREVMQSGPQKQVVLTASAEWLAQTGLDQIVLNSGQKQRAAQELAIHHHAASAQMLQIATHLLHSASDLNPLNALQQESQALALLAIALQEPDSQTVCPLNSRAQQRIKMLLDLLHSDLSVDWTLLALAKHLGSNPTTLQVHFRQATGYSIANYLRRLRLQQAYEQIRQGLSVTEAAFNAGYNSSANFATAFKRLYGISPRQAQSGY
ncbi:helix-turn-helix transcriptional regulator [Deefgea rivuli]|uniref:helix-turn-helix transcriptional regulator n=1 Tax=Deefgea rivuli TaxID=400948 RepID=UPI000687EFEF|nr:helix-turn-helix transcriptional regulator [Deefgea rivuli]